jgi:hypothetical protein
VFFPAFSLGQANGTRPRPVGCERHTQKDGFRARNTAKRPTLDTGVARSVENDSGSSSARDLQSDRPVDRGYV